MKSVLINGVIIGMTLSGCAADFDKNSIKTSYDLSNPVESLVLPDTLREISGLTDINQSTFACVQDENGILFIYDIVENRILNQYNFHLDGDYEGITRVENSIFILRSDGRLFEINDFQSSNAKIDSYDTGIPAENNEGLCYDPQMNRLLIATKGKVGKGKEFKDKRVIYGFDLETKILSVEPVFDFNLHEIKQFAIDNKIDLPVKEGKRGHPNEPNIKFMTSAIAVHPLNGKLYLFSAADHLFFLFSANGKLEHMEYLDPFLFNKAEGITFLENLDMLVTNEAQNKQATLLRFKYVGAK